MVKCENCTIECDGVYASGRFCGKFCAHSFAAKVNRVNRSLKTSMALTGKKSARSKEDYIKAGTRRTRRFLDNLPEMNFDSLPYETKRIRVLVEQNFCCNFCKRNEWLNRPLVLELDHVDGNKKNNARENLRALCPNCHSTTPTWRGRKKSFTSLRWNATKRIKEILQACRSAAGRSPD
jgi:hypothetical protein